MLMHYATRPCFASRIGRRTLFARICFAYLIHRLFIREACGSGRGEAAKKETGASGFARAQDLSWDNIVDVI